MINDTLTPRLAVVTQIRTETPDVKTFRVESADGTPLFDHMPGQCAMLTLPGAGEAMFSITSSPTVGGYKEFSIKRCGRLTDALHAMEPGQQIGIRGPYGKQFPVDTEFRGRNLLFIAGGIGLAPLHSVIEYVRAHREAYGHIDILYGSRSAADLVDLDRIQNEWMQERDTGVYLTIDRPQEGWDGHVGFVPAYLKELAFKPDCTAIICGPPIMIKCVLQALIEMGFDKTQVYTTLELKMK
ncbi:MAG: FAD/NAD(P)-binding protein, partial [Clostridia bacterium]|nr:FAD/NAD(P)-binding protein [Clostridia bacterium]